MLIYYFILTDSNSKCARTRSRNERDRVMFLGSASLDHDVGL